MGTQLFIGPLGGASPSESKAHELSRPCDSLPPSLPSPGYGLVTTLSRGTEPTRFLPVTLTILTFGAFSSGSPSLCHGGSVHSISCDFLVLASQGFFRLFRGNSFCDPPGGSSFVTRVAGEQGSRCRRGHFSVNEVYVWKGT